MDNNITIANLQRGIDDEGCHTRRATAVINGNEQLVILTAFYGRDIRLMCLRNGTYQISPDSTDICVRDRSIQGVICYI